MMMNATYISKLFDVSKVVFAPAEASCTLELTDCKEELLLLVDTTDCSGDTTLTLEGGDYASAKPELTLAVPAGSIYMIPVSTGEVMKTDGCLHLTFGGSYSGASVGALKKCFVVNH
jgi:hypothetical protein